MHPAPRGFGLSILTSRLGLFPMRGREGAVTVGFGSGWGVERPVVSGSGSIEAGGAIGSATPFIRKGLPYRTTVPGKGLYSARPELATREGCSRAYRPKAKHAPTAQ
jgi:hypothetical protein